MKNIAWVALIVLGFVLVGAPLLVLGSLWLLGTALAWPFSRILHWVANWSDDMVNRFDPLEP